MIGTAVMVITGAALGACASLPPLSIDEAVRRLLRRATGRALARLEAPGGTLDRFVVRLDLPALLGQAGVLLGRTMMSAAFHQRLDRWLRPAALRAAHDASRPIADAVRTMGITNARAVLAGGPHAATQLLRGELGRAVITAMIPAFRDALNTIDDPLLAPVVAALLDIGGDAIVQKFAHVATEAIWDAIGDEEAAIRADPHADGDPALAGALHKP